MMEIGHKLADVAVAVSKGNVDVCPHGKLGKRQKMGKMCYALSKKTTVGYRRAV